MKKTKKTRKRTKIEQSEYRTWRTFEVEKVIRYFNDNRPMAFVQHQLTNIGDTAVRERLAKLINRHRSSEDQGLAI